MTDSDRFWEWMAHLGIALYHAILVGIVLMAFTIMGALWWQYGELAWRVYQVGYAAGQADSIAPSPRLDPPL